MFKRLLGAFVVSSAFGALLFFSYQDLLDSTRDLLPMTFPSASTTQAQQEVMMVIFSAIGITAFAVWRVMVFAIGFVFIIGLLGFVNLSQRLDRIESHSQSRTIGPS